LFKKIDLAAASKLVKCAAAGGVAAGIGGDAEALNGVLTTGGAVLYAMLSFIEAVQKIRGRKAGEKIGRFKRAIQLFSSALGKK
jgi:hypothetical protein